MQNTYFDQNAQMKENLKVYIDHVVKSQDNFMSKLINRLNAIGIKDKLDTYASLPESSDWEKSTLLAIRNADIIVPIITPEYLGFVSDKILLELDNISKSSDRYIFPIIYSEANWGINKWIARSKVFPADSIPVDSLNEVQVSKVIDELINTIQQIASKPTEPIIKASGTLEEKANKGNLVFISHDHDDADFAELLKLKLEKEGISCWIDSERLKVGEDWRAEIDDAIEKALALIVVMSPDARKSEYVTYEWAFAWGKKVKVFPLMLKQTQLHPRLESLQYLDFTKRESRPYLELINSIKSLI